MTTTAAIKGWQTRKRNQRNRELDSAQQNPWSVSNFRTNPFASARAYKIITTLGPRTAARLAMAAGKDIAGAPLSDKPVATIRNP